MNAATIGELRASGWAGGSVKEELRRNVIQRLRDRKPVFSGIIGFDDTLAQNLAPALTTVAQPMQELGRRAFGMALSMIEGDQSPSSVRLPSRLVVRRSAGPPPR